MSDHKEKLSAFLDDDLQRDERLDADQDAARTLQHYNLIGSAMRGELNEATLLDISSQVRQAIDADAAATVPPVAAGDEVAAGRRSWFDLSGWLQPVGGLAIAASVAMVAVISLDQSDEPAMTGPATVAGNDAVEATMDAAEVRAVVADSRELPVIVPANDIRLEQYLDEHSEFAASDTLQGRLPYVRAVGYKTRAR